MKGTLSDDLTSGESMEIEVDGGGTLTAYNPWAFDLKHDDGQTVILAYDGRWIIIAQEYKWH